jgi:hypothetical protein
MAPLLFYKEMKMDFDKVKICPICKFTVRGEYHIHTWQDKRWPSGERYTAYKFYHYCIDGAEISLKSCDNEDDAIEAWNKYATDIEKRMSNEN